MLKDLELQWDLEAFFPGGSDSEEYREYLDLLEADVDDFYREVRELPGDPTSPGFWTGILEKAEGISIRLRHAGSFVSCLNAQDVNDRQAKILGGRSRQIGASYSAALTKLNEYMLNVPDADWARLLEAEGLQPVAFNLNESRQRAKDRLSTDQETLINDLSVDGYHGWNNVYNLAVSQVKIPIEEDGKSVQLSAAQAANKLTSAKREVRAEVFAKWEEAWAEAADFCAAALNHLAGYRLNVYRHRGWDDVLREPLEINRMTRGTLDTMWDTINQNKHRLVDYLGRKKKLLGLKELSWHDLAAPLGETETTMAFDEAANFVVDQVGRFSPKMATLMNTAFEGRWVEAEDRPGKRPGAFCTGTPVLNQSRVFMTFSGSMNNVSTLAHELGHAYHQHVMNDLPPMAQRYAMNVAETASTFSEMVVSDAALNQASDEDEKVALLGDKMQRAVALLMNIHSRFLFETRFYQERKKGLLGVEGLNQMMTEAQQEAYCNALDEYHPHFWASKLHFYITGVPFYNFPYTFGFLLSAGIYARALAEGPSFENKYVNLLRDTGRMKVEDLAAKHLAVDITKPGFWQSAIDVSLDGLDEFMRITESRVK